LGGGLLLLLLFLLLVVVLGGGLGSIFVRRWLSLLPLPLVLPLPLLIHGHRLRLGLVGGFVGLWFKVGTSGLCGGDGQAEGGRELREGSG